MHFRQYKSPLTMYIENKCGYLIFTNKGKKHVFDVRNSQLEHGLSTSVMAL